MLPGRIERAVIGGHTIEDLYNVDVCMCRSTAQFCDTRQQERVCRLAADVVEDHDVRVEFCFWIHGL